MNDPDPQDNIRRLENYSRAAVDRRRHQGLVDHGGGGGNDGDMEERVARLERDVGDIKTMLGALAPKIERMDATLIAVLPTLVTKAEIERISTTLPHLATKADLAEKPSKTYLWTVLGVLLATILAAAALGAALK